MKLLEKLVKQAVQDQHSAIRKEYKIPGYEKGFIDGFNKAVELIDAGLEKEGMPISIRHLVDREAE